MHCFVSMYLSGRKSLFNVLSILKAWCIFCSLHCSERCLNVLLLQKYLFVLGVPNSSYYSDPVL